MYNSKNNVPVVMKKILYSRGRGGGETIIMTIGKCCHTDDINADGILQNYTSFQTWFEIRLCLASFCSCNAWKASIWACSYNQEPDKMQLIKRFFEKKMT